MKNFNIILFLFIGYQCYGQSLDTLYNIKSLEGEHKRIYIGHGKHMSYLQVFYENDSLCTSDGIEITKAKLFDKRFLAVWYNGRGGSGAPIAYTIIFCIKDNKLHVPFNIISYSGGGMEYYKQPDGHETDSLILTYEYEIKNISINHVVGKKSDTIGYKMKVSIHEHNHSSNMPKSTWMDVTKNITLDFDPDKAIFYNSHKIMKKIADSTLCKATSFPTIDLHDDLKHTHYLFFNNLWYATGYGGLFPLYSTTCREVKFND